MIIKDESTICDKCLYNGECTNQFNKKDKNYCEEYRWGGPNLSGKHVCNSAYNLGLVSPHSKL